MQSISRVARWRIRGAPRKRGMREDESVMMDKSGAFTYREIAPRLDAIASHNTRRAAGCKLHASQYGASEKECMSCRDSVDMPSVSRQDGVLS